ncbi:MAG: zf-HC2 domain-containing protein [Myxococcales bacterium]|nr:zf-HC2 domain-containing protein [Myxococcales bacterium]
MTAPDLHPEELLDGAAAGVLSTEERARLDLHLSACPACRFELQARADFAAMPLPSMAVDELVTRALAGMPSASVAPARRRRFSPAMAFVAVLTVGAVSFAAAGLARPIAVLLGIAAPEVISQPVPAPSPRVQKPQPTVPVIEEELVAPPPPPLVEVPVVQPRVVVEERKLTPPPPPPAPAITAAELFRLATAARTEGRRTDAEQTYRELTNRFPSSPEANVSHAVMGRLLLDLNRPSDALVELDAALASRDGSLREDALANRALALDSLNDVVAARAAWELLLTEFPASIHARRAKERLEVLNAP